MKGDILPLSEVLVVFEQKTAAAFKVSLLLGAVAAGADKKTCDLLSGISYHIGLAFQMKDDLEDFKNTDQKALHFEDTSILLSMLFEMADVSEKTFLKEAYDQQNSEKIESLVELLSR